jgi:outer membrane protein assembly factor BamB
MMRHVRSRVRWLAIACALVVLVAGCDWSALGFGPANTNFNPSESALTESSVQHLKIAWSAPCACRDRALVSGGVVYVIDGYSGNGPYSLTLRAFDATSGTAKWSTPLGASVFGDVLSAVANGLVYVVVRPGSGSDRVVTFDAATGVVRWQSTPQASGVSSGPVVVVGPVLVEGALAFVAAGVNAATEVSALDSAGHVVWSAAPGGVVSPLAVDPGGRTVYTLSQLRLTNAPTIPLLTGYAEADGSLRSAVVAHINSTDAVTSLAFSNGRIFGTQVTGHSGQAGVGAFGMDPNTGALAWSGEISETVVTPDAVLDYTFLSPNSTVARNPATGAVLWQATGNGGAQAVAGNLVYSISSTGDAIAIRRIGDGSMVATVQPAVGDTFGALTPAAGHLFDATSAHLYALAPG